MKQHYYCVIADYYGGPTEEQCTTKAEIGPIITKMMDIFTVSSRSFTIYRVDVKNITKEIIKGRK